MVLNLLWDLVAMYSLVLNYMYIVKAFNNVKFSFNVNKIFKKK